LACRPQRSQKSEARSQEKSKEQNYE
jgi:hypothetical protein